MHLMEKNEITDTPARILLAAIWLLVSLFYLQPLTVSAQPESKDPDPFIKFNRKIYAFNEAFDEALFKPVALTYQELVPGFARQGVSNFFNNLDDVNVVFNDLLQLKMQNALQDSGRLVINTTIGIGGLLDVATTWGLYKNDEDFGQTLGYWGVPAGPYLVLPILGTSTLRHTTGLFPDYLMNQIFRVDNDEVRFFLWALDNIDSRVYYLAAESMVTGDEYTFVRDAFLQRREYLAADGEVYDEWDDF